MSVDYIEPRIEVIEDESTPPVKLISSNVIGVVGTFEKGPLNEKKTITSYDSLIKTFGKDKTSLTGCKSILSAMAQGAKEFVVIRIGGSSIKAASTILKDSTDKASVIITALNEGTWGNDILVAIVAGTSDGTFKLVVIYGSKTETFDNLTLSNVININSDYITAAVSSGAAAIPKNISAVPLTGGDDGISTVDSDYIGTITDGKRTGLKLMETANANIILCAQQYSDIIRNALITHCMNAKVRDGLRVPILNPPKGLCVDDVCKLTANLDTERGILSYPWNEFTDIPGQFIAPDGFYAGVLATGGAQESPSNKIINSIVSQEIEIGSDDIKTLTKAKISPIAPDSGYRIMNGLNLSTDLNWSQISIRREFDEIDMEVYESTRWVKSKNITKKIMQSVAEQIDALLEISKKDEKIYDFKPTVCDETNNTPETMAARILKTKIRVRPVFAADYVDHHIERYLGEE